jgi:hydroxyacylglutathione hydrolase
MEIINRYFRIGYFNIKGYNRFNVEDLKDDFVNPNILKFETLDTIKNRTHLDVRSKPEWQSVGILDGAITIPLGELDKRADELKGKQNIVINCMGGIRARVAFSILVKHGIEAHVIHEEVK